MLGVHSGDPNCLHIASIKVREGDNYTVVVSDQDSFDAVLPIRTVKYLYVSISPLQLNTPEFCEQFCVHDGGFICFQPQAYRDTVLHFHADTETFFGRGCSLQTMRWRW